MSAQCIPLQLNMSSGLSPPLSASHPTLFSPHMGFTFGSTDRFLNVILWYIIWSHLLPVTTSRVDTSRVKPRRGWVQVSYDHLIWHHSQPARSFTMPESAIKTQTQDTYVCFSLSLSRSPLVAYKFSPPPPAAGCKSPLSKVYLCERERGNRRWEVWGSAEAFQVIVLLKLLTL